MKRLSVFFFLSVFFLLKGFGQSDLELKLSSLAFNLNPDKETSPIVVEPGLIFSYEFFLRDLSFSARFTQAIRMDDAAKLAGHTSAKFHKSLYQKWKSEFNIGAGVGIAYRSFNVDDESLAGNKNYTPSGNFEVGDLFLTGSVEYNYFFNRKMDFSVSIERAYPAKIALNVGFRYWISKKIKKRHKCMSCPDWG
ncbi:MAG: hypothetical protein K9H64_18205 [Bacteroidales bacterium]|nr:hypothetical protein [Bacteroidales bacterium]MCF8457969.1 hypothetical protein [Bacteroidales bacterium]